MPIYRHNSLAGDPVNISAFVAATRNGVLAGRYPILRGAANVIHVGTNQTFLSPIGNVACITRAYGLTTCASVIYHSTDPSKTVAGAWVHHAGSGVVNLTDVDNALRALGSPPAATVEVIFAHPTDEDDGYAESIATIISMGVLRENVVEIPNLMVSAFGIDNQGRIG